MPVATNKDQWVDDFRVDSLRAEAMFFADRLADDRIAEQEQMPGQ